MAGIIGSLLFPASYSLDDIPLNTVLSEEHAKEMVTSMHPVEFGAAITDNITPEPMRITVEGVLSDIQSNRFLDYGLTSTAREITNRVGLTDEIGNSRTRWQDLLNLQSSGKRFTLVTNLKHYPQMILKSLGTRQGDSKPDEVVFIAGLEEVLIVKTAQYEGSLGEIQQQVTSPNETAKNNQDTADRGEPKKPAGDNPGEVVNEAKNKSLAAQFIDSLK